MNNMNNPFQVGDKIKAEKFCWGLHKDTIYLINGVYGDTLTVYSESLGRQINFHFDRVVLVEKKIDAPKEQTTIPDFVEGKYIRSLVNTRGLVFGKVYRISQVTNSSGLFVKLDDQFEAHGISNFEPASKGDVDCPFKFGDKIRMRGTEVPGTEIIDIYHGMIRCDRIFSQYWHPENFELVKEFKVDDVVTYNSAEWAIKEIDSTPGFMVLSRDVTIEQTITVSKTSIYSLNKGK